MASKYTRISPSNSLALFLVRLLRDGQRALLEMLLDCAIGKNKEGEKPTTARERIMAGKVIASLKALNLKRAALELRRERQEGTASEVSLADLVGDVERRAEQRRTERDG
jgi:hypothetical protein